MEHSECVTFTKSSYFFKPIVHVHWKTKISHSHIFWFWHTKRRRGPYKIKYGQNPLRLLWEDINQEYTPELKRRNERLRKNTRAIDAIYWAASLNLRSVKLRIRAILVYQRSIENNWGRPISSFVRMEIRLKVKVCLK